MHAHSSFFLVRFRPSVRVSPSLYAMSRRNETTKTKLGHAYTCTHQAYVSVCEREAESTKARKEKETERNDCISVSRPHEYAYVKKKEEKKKRRERTP